MPPTLDLDGATDSIRRDCASGERVIEAARVKLLADAGVGADAVDTVFFTGGSSGVPLLREQIGALLPGARAVEGDLFGSIGAGWRWTPPASLLSFLPRGRKLGETSFPGTSWIWKFCWCFGLFCW